jgi:hypothetical protein
MTTKPRAHRVEQDAPRELEELRVTLNENASESTIEEMTLVCMPPVEPLSVDTVKPLHPGRNVPARCLDEKVKVIRHQAIGVTSPCVPFDDVLEDLLEPEPIADVGENVGLADAA